MPNYFFTDPIDDFENGDVINNGNFSQLHPGTEILVGKTLVINGGNWINVKAQPEWVIDGGNWAQIDRCSHLHPEFVEKHGLVECVTECKHMVNKTEIVIDGVLIDTVYEYQNEVL